MKNSKEKLTRSYELLQNVLQSAFQIPTILFTPPYADIKKIDLGLRAMVWTDYGNDQQKSVLRKQFRRLSPDYRKKQSGILQYTCPIGKCGTAGLPCHRSLS